MPPRRHLTVTCEICQEQFHGDPRQLTCGDECRLERRRRKQRARYAKDAEFREAAKRRALAYAAEHREAEAARTAAWYEENRDLALARQRAKNAADPERRRKIAAGWRKKNRYRAEENFRRRADRAIPSGWYADLLAGDPCSYCGGPCEEIDHIEAIANGGADAWDNYTAACRDCNRRKCALSMLHFMRNRLIDAELQGEVA